MSTCPEIFCIDKIINVTTLSFSWHRTFVTFDNDKYSVLVGIRALIECLTESTDISIEEKRDNKFTIPVLALQAQTVN